MRKTIGAGAYPVETGRFPFPVPVRDRPVVLGLGNVLFSDEGAGVHAARTLSRRYSFSPPIEIIDGGTMGLDLLPLFQDRDRILIIDAVDFGASPGHVRIVSGSAIAAVLNVKLSVHHIGLADLLFTAGLTREHPPDLCLIGVQPGSLELGLELSECISARLDDIITAAVRKLREWDVGAEASRDPIGEGSIVTAMCPIDGLSAGGT